MNIAGDTLPNCRYWYVCKMENTYMNQSCLCASQHSKLAIEIRLRNV